MNNYYTFTADGSLPARWQTKGGESEFCLGKDGQTFPSSVKIQKTPQDGSGMITLREYTSSQPPVNRNVKITTSANTTIDVAVSGSSGDFYVELNDLEE